MTLRRLIFWLHWLLGSLLGLLIVVMATTGFMMAYARQLNLREEATLERVTAPTLGSLSVLRERYPDARRFVIPRDPKRPIVVQQRDAALYVDRSDFSVLGPSALRAFFHAVEDVHRRLASGDVGAELVEVGALGCFILLLSGVVLWWPRGAQRPVFGFSRNKRWRGRALNWHKVFGFYTALPSVVFVACGLLIAHPEWIDWSPAEPAAAAHVPSGTAPTLDSLWLTALAATPADWHSVQLRLPSGRSTQWGFFFTVGGDGSQPTHWHRVSVDGGDGALLKVQTYESLPTAKRVVAWARWLHTGEALGLAGQTLAALSALCLAVLSVTGVYLSLMRVNGWRKPRDGLPRQG